MLVELGRVVPYHAAADRLAGPVVLDELGRRTGEGHHSVVDSVIGRVEVPVLLQLDVHHLEEVSDALLVRLELLALARFVLRRVLCLVGHELVEQLGVD